MCGAHLPLTSTILVIFQEEVVEILLDRFQVEAVYLQEQSIFAMYSYSAVSGIVGEALLCLLLVKVDPVDHLG